jgi:hypothetical protein
MSVPMKEETKELARPLPVLVPLIKQEIEEGEKAGLEHYRRAGEMLIEAKEQLRHGEFSQWLRRNFTLSRATATRYMKLVEVTQNARSRAFSSLSEATDSPGTRGHKTTWHVPVREEVARVDFEALREERQKRARENELVAQLKRQIIDIGCKAFATRLHPDKRSGSAEAMSRLNRAVGKSHFPG